MGHTMMQILRHSPWLCVCNAALCTPLLLPPVPLCGLRQAADGARGLLQVVQHGLRHLRSMTTLASRAGCCQAALSVPSGGFPAPPARVLLLGGLTAAGDRTGKGYAAGCWDTCPGKGCGDGSPHPESAWHGGCRGSGTGAMLRGLCGVCSGTGQFAGMLCVLAWLWLLGVSHCSAVSIPGSVAETTLGDGPGEWSSCAVPTPWPGRGAVQLSLIIPGQLLQLSGALMPCLAPCQDPACAWGPLAADPPPPCSGKAVCLSPAPAPLPMPLCLPAAQGHGCCPSHAKPLHSRHAGAAYPSPRASRSCAVLGDWAPSVWLCPRDTPNVPHPMPVGPHV